MTLPGTQNPAMVVSGVSAWVLGLGKGWAGLEWTGLPGAPLEAAPSQGKGWAPGKMGEQGHLENLDFSAV